MNNIKTTNLNMFQKTFKEYINGELSIYVKDDYVLIGNYESYIRVYNKVFSVSDDVIISDKLIKDVKTFQKFYFKGVV